MTGGAQTPIYNEYQRTKAAEVNLNYPVTMFKNRVLEWDKHRMGMDIAVTHLRQGSLPSVVFPDGEDVFLLFCWPPWRPALGRDLLHVFA